MFGESIYAAGRCRRAFTRRAGVRVAAAGKLLVNIVALAALAGCGGGGSGGGSGAAGGGTASGGGAPGGGGAAPPSSQQTESQRFCATAVRRRSPETPADPPAYSVDSAEIENVGVPAIRESPCTLRGTIDGIRFRIVLPERWNGELHFLGGEHFGGQLDKFPASAEQDLDGLPPAPGSMLVETDGGHRGSPFDASWALGNERAVRHFAEEAVHLVLMVAVREARARYGVAPTHRIFVGFDDGGRQALVAAQRHPEDFDGIIAAAPRLNLTGEYVNALRIQKLRGNPLSSASMLSHAQRRMLREAALDACDDDDGVRDGVIGNYHACRFDPAPLRCGGQVAEEDICLTDAQLDLLKATREDVAAGYVQVDGVDRLRPAPVGYEGNFDWTRWINGEEIDEGVSAPFQYLFAEQFFVNFVVEDPDVDVLQLDLAPFADVLARRSAQLDATRADLAAFAAAGGKLILWHGTADYAVPLASSIEYFERVRATHPAPGNAARPAASDFFRFYVAVGSDHSGEFDGIVPPYNATRLITLLRTWLNAGTPPPEMLSVTEVVDPDTGATATQHLCQYPRYPRTDAGQVTCANR